MSDPTKIIIARTVFPLTECSGSVGNVLVIENDPLPQPPAPPVVTYSNVAITVDVKRNDCGAGKAGTSVPFSVPAGKFTSQVSQAAADALAKEYIRKNSQDYANLHGTCELTNPYKNVLTRRVFYRNNCEGIGNVADGGTLITVDAGKYESWISQADADAKAEAECLEKGQANANMYGSCAFGGSLVKLSLDCDFDVDFKVHYLFTSYTTLKPVVYHDSVVDNNDNVTTRDYCEAVIKKSDFPVYIYKTQADAYHSYPMYLARFMLSDNTKLCRVAISCGNGWYTVKENQTSAMKLMNSGNAFDIQEEVIITMRAS